MDITQLILTGVEIKLDVVVAESSTTHALSVISRGR